MFVTQAAIEAQRQLLVLASHLGRGGSSSPQHPAQPPQLPSTHAPRRRQQQGAAPGQRGPRKRFFYYCGINRPVDRDAPQNSLYWIPLLLSRAEKELSGAEEQLLRRMLETDGWAPVAEDSEKPRKLRREELEWCPELVSLDGLRTYAPIGLETFTQAALGRMLLRGGEREHLFWTLGAFFADAETMGLDLAKVQGALISMELTGAEDILNGLRLPLLWSAIARFGGDAEAAGEARTEIGEKVLALWGGAGFCGVSEARSWGGTPRAGRLLRSGLNALCGAWFCGPGDKSGWCSARSAFPKVARAAVELLQTGVKGQASLSQSVKGQGEPSLLTPTVAGWPETTRLGPGCGTVRRNRFPGRGRHPTTRETTRYRVGCGKPRLRPLPRRPHREPGRRKRPYPQRTARTARSAGSSVAARPAPRRTPAAGAWWPTNYAAAWGDT